MMPTNEEIRQALKGSLNQEEHKINLARYKAYVILQAKYEDTAGCIIYDRIDNFIVELILNA
jgi:hypothetical protein